MKEIKPNKCIAFFKPAWDFFKSIKLAVGLIIYFALTSILATLVPQAREAAFYTGQYPPFLSWLITSTGFNDFFRSFLFLFPALLFTVNLSVCMVHRLIKEFSGKGKKYFGPDIIHIGILILIVGAMLTFITRKEAFFNLTEGEKAKLGGKYLLELKSFDFLQYEDGRPKAWISTVAVHEGDKVLIPSFAIEVNKPLTLNGLKVYQTSYNLEKLLVLQNEDGTVFSVPAGHPVVSDGTNVLVFSAAGETTAGGTEIVFEKYRDKVPAGKIRYAAGDKIGNLLITGIMEEKSTGLTVVIDAGFLPVLIASILIALGLTLTYIQKIGVKKT